VVFGTLLVLAFVTPLRLAVSLASSAFRAATRLGASRAVAALAATWVMTAITGAITLLVLRRPEHAALTSTAVLLPYALLVLHRSFALRGGRRDARPD
jgi:hypothetical protein